MKTDTNSWGLFRKSAAVGVVLLLTMAGFSRVAEAGNWIRRDWSKVQRVLPGTRTRVLLYKDRAPGGIRKIEGLFKIATSEAVTLSLPSGRPHTLQKQDVARVLVYRPVSKRYPGWITLGVAAGVSIPIVAKSGSDVESWGKWLLNGAFIGGPTLIAFLVTPKWGGVYNVPRKLRDDPAPTGSPSRDKDNSGAPASGAKDPSSDPAGSTSGALFLNRKPDPESARLQARRAVMRQDLPLDLPSLPAPGAQTGSDL